MYLFSNYKKRMNTCMFVHTGCHKNRKYFKCMDISLAMKFCVSSRCDHAHELFCLAIAT